MKTVFQLFGQLSMRNFQELRTKVQQKKKNLSKKFLGFSDFDDIDMPPGGTKE